jgi:hypothetical protein
MKKTLSESHLSKPRFECRACKGKALIPVLSLAPTPPANAFLTKADLLQPEPFFPLDLDFCTQCSFVQLRDIVSPELLFRDYVYVSSTSPVFVTHFEELAKTISRRFSFIENSLIVDIGSNDGILLKPFKKLGFRVLGIDPAEKIAREATANGVETIPEFFTPALAKKILEKHGSAALITATSAFPHIDNLDEIVEGVRILLKKDGVFMVEAYYLGDLISKNLFDTIYHEHLSYFSVRTAIRLFERLDMEVFDVEKTDTHGGSLRIFAELRNGPHALQRSHIQKFLKEEMEHKLHESLTYQNFSHKILKNKVALTELLRYLKKKKKFVAGYGAPAKGTTLLTHFGIGPETLEYIVDDSHWKQGLYMPGTHIPVFSSAKLAEKNPDYILILAWNFADPIMKKLSSFKANGGKFIIPVPEPKLV